VAVVRFPESRPPSLPRQATTDYRSVSYILSQPVASLSSWMDNRPSQRIGSERCISQIPLSQQRLRDAVPTKGHSHRSTPTPRPISRDRQLPYRILPLFQLISREKTRRFWIPLFFKRHRFLESAMTNLNRQISVFSTRRSRGYGVGSRAFLLYCTIGVVPLFLSLSVFCSSRMVSIQGVVVIDQDVHLTSLSPDPHALVQGKESLLPDLDLDLVLVLVSLCLCHLHLDWVDQHLPSCSPIETLHALESRRQKGKGSTIRA
jgi:hypothetical protein